MAIPNLQVALDHNRIEDALKDALAVGNEVDIIEAGTILLLNEGDKAIKCLRSAFPDKVIIADTKCADAGTTVAKNVALAGADWMTVICCATIPTMEAANKEVKSLQVELYGDWTFEQAQQWSLCCRSRRIRCLRYQFAEFLLPSSLKRLRILILPTCVGLRYGSIQTEA